MSRAFASAAFALLAACSNATFPQLPPIADKLPPDVRDAEPEFDRRVQAAFPVGASEQQTVSSLKETGFQISPAGSDGYASADLKRGNMVCQTIWSVRWKADAGTIREIFGVYGHRCP